MTREDIDRALLEQRRGSVMPLPDGLTLYNPAYMHGRDDGRIDFRGVQRATGLWNAIRRLLGRATPDTPREVTFCRYDIADSLLRENTGWRIAAEEGSNRRLGWVWLERDAEEHDHGRIA